MKAVNPHRQLIVNASLNRSLLIFLEFVKNMGCATLISGGHVKFDSKYKSIRLRKMALFVGQ